MLNVPKPLHPLTGAGVTWSLPLLGLLPALAHPPWDWTFCAWLALAPALWWLRHAEGGTALWLGAGWGYGLVHAATQYSWLPDALWHKGGLTLPVFLAFSIALLAVAAAYPAAAFALSRWAWLRWGISPYAVFPAAYAAQDAMLSVTPFGGAPWGSLAATQTGTVAAAWLVPGFGGAGLALALAAAGSAWAIAFDQARRVRGGGGFGGAPLPFVLAALLTGICAWPAASAREAPLGGKPVRMLMVPGDLSLTTLAAPSEGPAVVRGFAARTLAATAAVPGGARAETPILAVWPESAAPGNAERGKLLADLFALSAGTETDLLFGSNGESFGRVHNSAYLVSGERFATIRYDKKRLVPFGEYVPAGFGALFGKKLTAGVRDYTAGDEAPVLNWRGVKLGLAICFESILPGHAREAANAGAEVLITISNDAWLTPSAARQHVQLSALRALEVGRELVFVANGGASAHVSGGRVVQEVPRGGAPRLVTVRPRQALTPWARWGWATTLTLMCAWLAVSAGAGPLLRAVRQSTWRRIAQ